jgi:hypothetical protein
MEQLASGSGGQNHMVSDYGNHMSTESKQSNSACPLTSTKTNRNESLNYASAAQRYTFPSKEQAIVMDSIDGVQLNEYIFAISKLVNPSDIKFASKMSMNRVCLYLSNKELVNSLIGKHRSINIGNATVSIRPLITKYTRVVLSNVCPVIPHHVIETKLRKLNIRLASSITFLRVGISQPGFSHILSFRRQVYIHPDDVSKVPSSLKIDFDETSYWLYLSTDGVSCFLCKERGHLARNCEKHIGNITEDEEFRLQNLPQNEISNPGGFPEVVVVEQTQSKRNDIPVQSLFDNDDFPELVKQNKTEYDNVKPKVNSSVNEIPKITQNNSSTKDHVPSEILNRSASPTLIVSSKATKRPLSLNNSDSLCSEHTVETEGNVNDKKATRNSTPKKKVKTERKRSNEYVDLDEHLSPLKEKLASNPHVLNFEQLKSFIERSIGNQNIEKLSSEYTTDTEALILLLRQNYVYLQTRNMKNRFTRIINKLSNSQMTGAQSDTPASTDDEQGEVEPINPSPDTHNT